jgi:DNA-binding response OmpR family regulator
VLRRSAVPAPAPNADRAEGGNNFSFDGLTAYPDRLELLDRGNAICDLTSSDFKLLSVFLNAPKRVLSRDQLMDLTGGVEWSPLDRTIDNQVARLRKKIERDPSKPKLIKTVRGIGYTFASDVQAVQPMSVPAKSA